MTKLINLELRQWSRNKGLFIMMILFIFTSITASLTSYYIKDILEGMTSADIQSIVVKEPVWQDLLSSYYKSSSQLILFVAYYLIGRNINIYKNEPLEYYYKSYSRSVWRVYGPKIIAGMAVLTLASILGFIVTLGITVTLFENVDFKVACISYICHYYASLCLLMVSLTITIYTKSTFSGPVVVMFIIMLAEFLMNWDKFSQWSIISLLKSNDILFDNPDYDIPKPVLIGLAMIVICLILISLKKTRKNAQLN